METKSFAFFLLLAIAANHFHSCYAIENSWIELPIADPSSSEAEQNGLNLAEETVDRISSIVEAGDKWCDQCVCRDRINHNFPPQCICQDSKPYCYHSCKSCRCTKSIPPQCRCNDVKKSC